ncbi:MAG: hypothetical protein NXI04_17315 [Planctomycetaceae bacterium]|nr:hypothetical protein [Planctomycetaceae bacterium]
MNWDPFTTPVNLPADESVHVVRRLLRLLCHAVTGAAAVCLLLATAGVMAGWLNHSSVITTFITDLFRCGAFLLLLRGVLVSVFLHHPALTTDE